MVGGSLIGLRTTTAPGWVIPLGSVGDQLSGQVVLSADVGQAAVAAFEEVGQILVVQTQQ